MIAVSFVLIAALTVGITYGRMDENANRTFTVDHERNTFLMDGQPFRYVSGSFHYFRALPEVWEDRLKTMRAAGLNAVDTYVEWSLHNPHENVYNWEGIADVERFIELAADVGFYVILRPGPYICAERDNGGLPHWLFKKYPNIKMRTSDKDYQNEVATWYAQLMSRFKRFMYGNGGPIIMVQIENEYGAFHACDEEHLIWLRDETEKYVHGNALLFTTDIPDERIACGKIEHVFATTDFGIDRIDEIDEIWKRLRSVQPTGPLVNSEFYPGWLTHWQEDNQRRDGRKVADALKVILGYGASVNFYMFFGGTNFGFTAGANDFGAWNYTADITSYDYDAVMDEAGGVTEKYGLVHQVISELEGLRGFANVTHTVVKTPRVAYGQVTLAPIVSLLSKQGLAVFTKGSPVNDTLPKTFEELDQYSGLALYETNLPRLEIDPTLLTVERLRDRGFVFVDERLVGVLSRENGIYSVPISKGWGSKLQILVENQGRINFNIANDTKGITGEVTVQKLNGEKQILTNWTSISLPLDGEDIEKLIKLYKNEKLEPTVKGDSSSVLAHGPVAYFGEFAVKTLGDTYLNTSGWGKGVAYVNGFNVGRYWPLAGPQITLYVPQVVLHHGRNSLLMLEYQLVNNLEGEGGMAQLDASPQLDG